MDHKSKPATSPEKDPINLENIPLPENQTADDYSPAPVLDPETPEQLPELVETISRDQKILEDTPVEAPTPTSISDFQTAQDAKEKAEFLALLRTNQTSDDHPDLIPKEKAA